MKVLQAAIMDCTGMIHTLPRPDRHCDIIHKMFKEGLSTKSLSITQGFILDDGTFVNRQKAAKIAFEAKQCSKLECALYSEDLW